MNSHEKAELDRYITGNYGEDQPRNENQKEYIGDGVYVQNDGFMIILTTENGVSVTNTICLEPAVYNSLVNYVNKLVTK